MTAVQFIANIIIVLVLVVLLPVIVPILIVTDILLRKRNRPDPFGPA